MSTEDIAPQKRPRPSGLRPFQPGQSGNPGGMPKGVGELRRAAREHSADAIETLVKAMNSPSAGWSARITAAMALLDRGYGKPTQPLDIADGRPLSSVATEDLVAAVAALAASMPKTIEGEVAE